MQPNFHFFCLQYGRWDEFQLFLSDLCFFKIGVGVPSQKQDHMKSKGIRRNSDRPFEKMNEARFKLLFDTYKERLYRYVLALTHSNFIAEEITQEIFIKLWLCRDILLEVENTDGYIFTIARNKTLNYLRKAYYDLKLLRELQKRAGAENNNVEERSLAADYNQLIRDALAMLSPQRRIVYQLSRQEGLNQEEIALHLHLSPNTVKNHLVEALRFIRNYLGEHRLMLLLILFFIRS
jgi:RNA polymerase sigma-70 factor (family 1)